MKLFEMKDENFICENCSNEVKQLGYSARNHCPTCLVSKHVDVNPGDRQETCMGLLRPIMIEGMKKGNYKIKFKCDKCLMERYNISARDDSFDSILEIMRAMDNN